MVRGLLTDHSFTWTDLMDDGILELFQVHSGTFVCLFVLLKSEAAFLRFTRPQRTQAMFQACNVGLYCVCQRVWWVHIKLFSISEQYCGLIL